MIRVIRWIPLLFAIFFCSPLVADDPAPPAATPSKLLRQPELPKLTPKQQLEVQNWVRELQRQRATNRTRAEKQLYRYGAAAVPYLLPVSRSRFDLARIAALRVLLKSPRYEAVPAALEGLQAENRWVRKLSWQLIEKISGIRSSFPWEEKDLSGLRRKKSADLAELASAAGATASAGTTATARAREEARSIRGIERIDSKSWPITPRL